MQRLAQRVDLEPAAIPPSSPSGISSTLASRKPTASASTGCAVRRYVIDAVSPIAIGGPLDSITVPITWLTLPLVRIKSASNRSSK